MKIDIFLTKKENQHLPLSRVELTTAEFAIELANHCSLDVYST